MEKVIEDVKAEIARQDAIWGKQTHPGFKWACLLTEEMGEFAKAILEKDILHAREEIIQVAALAAQVADAIDREITQ